MSGRNTGGFERAHVARGLETTGRYLVRRSERRRRRDGHFVPRIAIAERHARCAQQFEDFCTVTESIRHGIPVKVRVPDGAGKGVHEG